MTDLNTVNMIGRLTRDAHYSEVGNTVKADISLAVNRSKKNGDQWIDEVSYFDLVLWGKMADSYRKYLLKGKQIAFIGHAQQERWENKNGEKKSKIVFVIESLQVLTKDNNNNSAPASAGFTPADNSNDIPW